MKSSSERLALRLSYGLDVQQWARALYFSPSSVYRWETRPCSPDPRAVSFMSAANKVPLEKRKPIGEKMSDALLVGPPLRPLFILLTAVVETMKLGD